MIAFLLSCTALVTSCAAPVSSPTPVQVDSRGLFPEPKSGIVIRVDTKLDEMLLEFSKATGLHLVVEPRVAEILKQHRPGILADLDTPKSEVYPVVENLLFSNSIVLSPLTDREPRLFAVKFIGDLGPQGSLRTSAVYVPVADIPSFARHPAILVTTTLNLPSTDVRTLSNSMRTMFTDANTQQIIPVGNSNSLIITGFGGQVASIVAMLQRIDEEARKDIEAAEKRAKELPPAPVLQPPK